MKKRSLNFIYALALYCGISVFFIMFQFLIAGALVYLLYRAVILCAGPAGLRLVTEMTYDSVGFAFLTASNTILQYYLASLLGHNLRDRSALLGIVFISAMISSIFFLRLSARSAFGSYVFASLPLIFSYLLGAIMGLFQKEPENPFHNSKVTIFRID